MSGTAIYGPIFIEGNVTKESYGAVLEEFIASLYGTYDGRDFDRIWFMKDGATTHTAHQSLAILHEHFGPRIFSGRYPQSYGCGVDWPPYSPDLNPCDYFLWGYLKGRVYKDAPMTLDALKQAITREIEAITPETLRKVMLNFRKRLILVQEQGGRHIEHLLKFFVVIIRIFKINFRFFLCYTAL